MDDRELIEKCIQGDKQSWEEFLTRYSRLIYNYLYAILKFIGTAYTEENIHDLFHEIFITLAKDNGKKLKSFQARNNCNFASWLRQVATNAAIDYVRKNKTQISIHEPLDDGSSLNDLLADGSLSVVDSLSFKERLIHLEDCVENLELDDQYFIELHINQGLSLDEVKDSLKQSRGAIDMRKSRIIERLKECFKSKGLLVN